MKKLFQFAVSCDKDLSKESSKINLKTPKGYIIANSIHKLENTVSKKSQIKKETGNAIFNKIKYIETSIKVLAIIDYVENSDECQNVAFL